MEFPRFQHPFTMLLAGPTRVGKSWFLRDLLAERRKMFNPPPDKVIWFYGIYQQLYDGMHDVIFVEGFPSNYREYLGATSLIILDDLMMECGDDERLTYLFTKGSHHLNLSVIFITQNLFHKGKEMRSVSLNSQYLVLFKNRRDMTQIIYLGRQLYPRHSKFFQEVFEDATKKPFSYLLVDLRNETVERMRLRTQILPGQTQFVYEAKKCLKRKKFCS